MRRPSLHSNFFSSLKQVEKRLKLGNPSQPSKFSSSPQEKQLPDNNLTQTESLSSPIYLHFDQTNKQNDINSSSILQESSEPPQAFLSCSPQFPLTQQNPPQADRPKTTHDHQTRDIDDIEFLIQLLGLSDYQQEEGEEQKEEGLSVTVGGNCCDYEDGFFEKIVGVKGPKCKKELERLEGWIKCFLRERKEPLRMAFLLLGKAAFVSGGSDSGFGGLEFPSAIDQFLKNDPPKD